jgi:hypothetical protein
MQAAGILISARREWVQMPRRLKSGLIKLTTKDVQKMDERCVFVLWYEDSNGREHFCGSFPTAAEAHQHEREGLGHLRRAEWRYAVCGYDIAYLAVVHKGVGQMLA